MGFTADRRVHLSAFGDSPIWAVAVSLDSDAHRHQVARSQRPLQKVRPPTRETTAASSPSRRRPERRPTATVCSSEAGPLIQIKGTQRVKKIEAVCPQGRPQVFRDGRCPIGEASTGIVYPTEARVDGPRISVQRLRLRISPHLTRHDELTLAPCPQETQ